MYRGIRGTKSRCDKPDSGAPGVVRIFIEENLIEAVSEPCGRPAAAEFALVLSSHPAAFDPETFLTGMLLHLYELGR